MKFYSVTGHEVIVDRPSLNYTSECGRRCRFRAVGMKRNNKITFKDALDILNFVFFKSFTTVQYYS